MKLLGIIFAWLLLFCSTCIAEERLALLIANSRYENIQPLRNPENDVQLVAQSLKETGFDPQIETNLTIERMSDVISEFLAKVKTKPGATVLFYYAGHGVQISGENYALPIDIAGLDNIPKDAIEISSVLEELQRLPSRIQIVILDACRDDPLGEQTRGAIPLGLNAEAPTRAGRLVAFSTSPGKTAADGDTGTSPYAGALAESILIPGLRVEDMFARVRAKVLERTEGKQEPWESAALTEEVFHFIPPAANSSQVDDEEQTIWDLASIVGTEGAYQRYLEQYPRGRYVSLATIKIDAYNRDQTFFHRNETFPLLITRDVVSLCGEREFGEASIDDFLDVKQERVDRQVFLVRGSIHLPNIFCRKDQSGRQHPELVVVPGPTEDCQRLMSRVFAQIDIFPDDVLQPRCWSAGNEEPETGRYGLAELHADLAKAGGGISVQWNGGGVTIPTAETGYWDVSIPEAEGYFEEAYLNFGGFAQIKAGASETYAYFAIEPFDPRAHGLTARADNTSRRLSMGDRLNDKDVIYIGTDSQADGEIEADGPDHSGMEITSFWSHNGSLMAFLKGGDKRQFVYFTMKPSLVAAGIEENPVLFWGTVEGDKYIGRAQVISKNCKKFSYPASGQLSGDGRQITLEGTAPKLDADCNQVGERPERMIFSLLGPEGSFDPFSFDLASLKQ